MEKFPKKSVQVALTGNTYATLVAAPPDTETAYRILKVFGQNNAGAARKLQLAFNNNATRTIVWESASVANGIMFSGTLGEEQFPVDIVLSNPPATGDTGHKLDMRLDDTGTDTIVCTYEILEAR
jgi:hypothetical protein